MIGFQSDAFQLNAVQTPAGATGDVDYTLEFDSGSYSVSGAEWELFYSRTQTDAGSNKRRRTYLHKDRRFRGLTEAEIEEILAFARPQAARDTALAVVAALETRR